MRNSCCYVIDTDKHGLQKIKTKDPSLYGWLSPEGDLVVSRFGWHKFTRMILRGSINKEKRKMSITPPHKWARLE